MNDLSNWQKLLPLLSLVYQGGKGARENVESMYASQPEDVRDDISDILDFLEEREMSANDALDEILKVLEQEDASS